MSIIEKRMEELGLKLPPFVAPKAAYVPTVRVGNLVFVSGQGVTRNGKEIMKGHVGKEITLEQAQEGAKICALNALCVLKETLGDLDRIKRIVKVQGFVNSAPGFDKQPLVINGFSELMELIFGENGKHARTAVSCNELPFGTPVEVDMIVEISN
ncbi:MAG TPA: RidA family protein [Christensenellaceae bacterium]|jgi:enamine deaminase RidA (YjgF/YER057c/UK114 family)|nr:RidA family protein [Christensenellaceae bacterium]